MNVLRRPLRLAFETVEGWLNRVFGTAWNPLYNLGALGFFFYWIVAVSGIYVYALFDTGIERAYTSIAYMTDEQWYLGGVMRSLHRYASDAMVLVMVAHLLREFALDRYRGARWFSWFTGVPIVWLLFISGITGYWLVWDKLAQYIATATAEWLDWLPVFGVPIARNFMTPDKLDSRFFTLLIFMHILVPLFLLLAMWIHLQRVSRPKVNPARGLAIGSLAALLALSLAWPAVSQAPADLATVPAVVDLDWFYLAVYPLLDIWPSGAVWAFVGTLTLMLAVLPWMPPMRRPAVARVDLDNCNGCGRCVDDCPFAAVTLGLRTDGQPFSHQAVVDPALCVACGICAGACPTSTPFRRASDLVPGIDLPDLPLREVRERTRRVAAGLSGEARIIVFGCDHGVAARGIERDGVGVVRLPCIAMLPPAFIDYALSRGLADGVMLVGCGADACYHRFGVQWTEGRIAGTRDPYLRARVPRERLATLWAGSAEPARLAEALDTFAADLAAQAQAQPVRPVERMACDD